jgi:hypothetical protein
MLVARADCRHVTKLVLSLHAATIAGEAGDSQRIGREPAALRHSNQ